MREEEQGVLTAHHISGSAEDARNKVRAYFDDLRETVNRQEEDGLAVVNNYVREKLLSLRQQQEDMAVLMSQVTSVCLECERALKRSDAEVSEHFAQLFQEMVAVICPLGTDSILSRFIVNDNFLVFDILIYYMSILIRLLQIKIFSPTENLMSDYLSVNMMDS